MFHLSEVKTSIKGTVKISLCCGSDWWPHSLPCHCTLSLRLLLTSHPSRWSSIWVWVASFLHSPFNFRSTQEYLTKCNPRCQAPAAIRGARRSPPWTWRKSRHSEAVSPAWTRWNLPSAGLRSPWRLSLDPIGRLRLIKLGSLTV